jgi:hypothetical protein
MVDHAAIKNAVRKRIRAPHSGSRPSILDMSTAMGLCPLPRLRIGGIQLYCTDDPNVIIFGNRGLARYDRLWSRYQRFAHYMAEVRHQWVLDPSSVVLYADNSAEGEEISLKTGARRRAILTAPHGDRSY